jgi:hypothetical protein
MGRPAIRRASAAPTAPRAHVVLALALGVPAASVASGACALALGALAFLAAPGPVAAQEPQPAPSERSAPRPPTRTAIRAPASFFSIQDVSTSGAAVVVAGDAASGRVEVDWFDAGSSPRGDAVRSGPDRAGPGVVRAHGRRGEGGPGGAAAAPLGTTVAASVVPGRVVEARLSGLAPDRRYRYVVRGTGGARLHEAIFGTPPLPGGRAITFAVIGDTGELPLEYLGAPSAKAAVARAVLDSEPRPELVLHMGDVVYPDGSWAFYKAFFFGPMQPLMGEIPVFASLGNHDVRAEMGRAWLEVFSTRANNADRTERYYSFDWGDVHFVALDSASSPIDEGSPQRRFLEEDLAASDAAWKVVYFHHPPFSDAAHKDDERLKRELVPLLERAKVDLVLSGHDHCYERLRPVNGVTYVVSGGGGARPYEIEPTERLVSGRSVHHFVRGRADARRLTLEAIDTDGRVFDAVSLER